MFERVLNTPYSVMHTIHPMSMLPFSNKKYGSGIWPYYQAFMDPD